MNEYLRCRRDCQIGVKAYQNIRASLLAFERLCTLVESDDHLLLSSVFHMGVIRYAKPFLGAESGAGLVSYPTQQLRKVSGFSVEIHRHLLTVRNTLIAHDDFDQIEPRILIFGFNPNGFDIQIPTSVVIANKCISHPAYLDGARKIRDHIAPTLSGVQQKLLDDLGKLRSIGVAHPEQAKQAMRYSRHYGRIEIPKSGTQLTTPDFMNENWLEIEEPDFSAIHNGFRYEEVRVRRDFHGPEKIRLPDGAGVEITPSERGKQ